NQQDGNDDRQRNPSHTELPPLPGSSATAAAPTAGKATSAPTTATATCRRLRDCGAQRAGEPFQAAGEDHRIERARALVPGRDGGACVDALERPGPAVDAAEDDRIGQVLGKDFRLFRERLPVLLRAGHVEAESQCLPDEIGAQPS